MIEFNNIDLQCEGSRSYIGGGYSQSINNGIGNLFDKMVLQPVLENVCSRAQAAAFCIGNKFYTYKEFGDEIVRFRMAIRHSTTHSNMVGLAIHDDLQTYAAIFALWLEGKAYIPLHPNQPLERNLSILSQIEGLQMIIDSSENTPYKKLYLTDSNNKYEVLTPSSLLQTEIDIDFDDNLITPFKVDDNELAYILFTSGSTGVPKGVQISRGNLAHFIDSFWKTGIEVSADDKCLQCFDLTFDVSVQSYLVPLLKGACCFTVPYGKVKYMYVASLISKYHISFGAVAPSMLTYLRPYFEELEVSSLRNMILTAEACPLDLIVEFSQYAQNCQFWDFYGPTEGTIYCTAYKLKPKDNLSLNGIISIGKPLDNVVGIIIDEDANELEDGVKGELCIAGGQITKGYYNNDEKNSSSFFDKEVNGNVLRFYHTGDLCYKTKDGNIMYSGRIDQQAKIQGFRVELGEIEYYARAFYDNQLRVIAIAFDNDKNLTEIALFVESDQKDSRLLVEYLKSKLPHYMIPSRILYESQFPLNKSEKVDRNILREHL